MRSMLRRAIHLLCDEHGPTAVEYAMLVLLAMLALLTVVVAVGQKMAVG